MRKRPRYGLISGPVFILILAISGDLSGQSIEWLHTGGPNGLDGRATEVSPDGTIYIGTFGGGVARSRDQGQTWESLGLDHVHGIYDFGFSNSQVFAATWDGIYRTEETLVDWQLVYHTEPTPSAAFSLQTAPPNTVFAGVRGQGLLRSRDGGDTWFAIGDSLGSTEFSPDALTLDPEGNLLVGTGDGLFSLEQASPWVAWKLVSPDSLRVESVKTDHEGNIFIGTSGQYSDGVLWSTDHGQSWTSLTRDLGRPSVNVISVASQTILAGTTQGVYRTRDLGTSWTLLPGAGSVFDLDVDSNGVLYVGLYIGSGVRRLIPPDDTLRHAGLPFTRNFDLAGDEFGNVYSSVENAGIAQLSPDGVWRTLTTPGSDQPKALMTGSDSIVVAATDFQLLRSFDSGTTWTVAESPPCSEVNSFRLGHDGTIYAATGPAPIFTKNCPSVWGGVYYAPDFGLSWIELGLAGERVTDVLVPADSVILATTETGVHRSIDSGETWSRVLEFTGWSQDAPLASTSTGRIFAGTFSGIYHSDDFGETWTPSSLEYGPINDLEVSAGDAVAAGYDRGVILSFDLGESWNEMNLGLPEKPVNRLTFDRRGHLLASIPGRGVFKTNEAVPTLSNPDPLPGSFATVDVYPNPAQSFVRFSFRLPVRTTVSLSVFDLLGRETAILLQNQTLAAGPHHAVWDAGGMAPGIYLFSLSGESILGRGAVVIN